MEWNLSQFWMTNAILRTDIWNGKILSNVLMTMVIPQDNQDPSSGSNDLVS